MNRAQSLFVLSFLSTFILLVSVAYFVSAKLAAAGYDISRLILIGLDHSSPPTMSANTAYTQFIALALAIAYQPVHLCQVRCQSVSPSPSSSPPHLSPSERAPVLNPKEFQQFTLGDKIVVSPNTAIYRFALPRPDDVLGLPIGQHISISAEIDGKEITRSYTPTSSDDDLGHFDLLIKVFPLPLLLLSQDTQHLPQSYEKGNISRYVSLLKIGDKVKIRGPKGFFKYSPTLSLHIGMIAGGTGITPMLQIIRAALKNPTDKTKLTLIYANVNMDDILLKKELDNLAAKHPHRFTVYYVLNNPPENWTGGVGFVSKEQIEKYMPRSSNDTKLLMCGPPPMMTAMKKHLAELNYPSPRTVSKLEDQASSRELGYAQDDIETRVINIRQGENFAPPFLNINPMGTLPTMAVGGQSYTTTVEVTSYLVKHAPRPVKPGTSFIAKIHEEKYDPNFPTLLACSDEELQQKAATFAMDFIRNRQDALGRYSSQSDATQHKAFYDSKLASNGILLSIYQGTTPDHDKQAFFQRSASHWNNLKQFISEELARLLPDTTFFGGDDPSEDDFHLAAWLARIAFVAGGGNEQDGVRALENGLGIELHPKISAYWSAWSSRKSWQEVYAEGLH
ncbi:hypothetical protein J3R83DRAFT_6767 [Lanmaoa asiatica]|nr:hypothetical protein J3R83DRAFT_6767 [Lanmaoa asiatica]